jgi:hypothetical protein
MSWGKPTWCASRPYLYYPPPLACWLGWQLGPKSFSRWTGSFRKVPTIHYLLLVWLVRLQFKHRHRYLSYVSQRWLLDIAGDNCSRNRWLQRLQGGLITSSTPASSGRLSYHGSNIYKQLSSICLSIAPQLTTIKRSGWWAAEQRCRSCADWRDEAIPNF